MRQKLKQSILMGIAILLTISCGGNREETRTVLHFSAIPDQNTTELQEKFQPLADYLSGQLGIAVEYVPARDYQASVEMFKNGDVHLAWFGGLTGVQARQAVPGARAIAQGASDPEYYTYFIAHRDAGLAEKCSTVHLLAGGDKGAQVVKCHTLKCHTLKLRALRPHTLGCHAFT